MASTSLIVRSTRVVLPDGVAPAAIHVENGRIKKVAAHGDVPSGRPILDAGESVVMPGVVDTHVHINEPGRTEWEGFDTATRAAAAGGVTTLIDMPLNSVPPTTTVAGLEAKMQAAEGKCFVDVGFWGGLVPGNRGELRRLHDAGVFGFKCFLSDPGVPEFPRMSESALRLALPELRDMGAVLLVHAELPGPLLAAEKALGVGADERKYETYLASRPVEAEVQAVTLLVKLCREFRTRIHVVHVASAETLAVLRGARELRLPITAETCPHYLHYAAEMIRPGATEFKCAPPIRDRENRERLWAGLIEGVLDMIVSDHSPCPPELKHSGDFLKAWGGIAGLQLSLSVAWLQARQRGFGLERVARWMCAEPAQLAGLENEKGYIAEGYDADLVVWRPEADVYIDPLLLLHRHKLTPYADAVLAGFVDQTFLRGVKIYDRGRFPQKPTGRILTRPGS